LWRQNGASVSSAGTGLHADIERFMNIPNTHTHRDLLEQFTESCNEDEKETSVEWEYFINFVRDFPFMTPYRTEWMIYDEELKIAGSVDMVYLNDDGTVSIYDWKRCQNIVRVNVYNKFALTPCISELHDTNYWHYSLQLNLYKYIIESKYNRLVSSMYLVQLHPDVDECNYVLHEVYPMTEGFHELMTDRKRFVESGAM
jgi:ATP-dependent exoDNAse (exonuclease V) beta subunit